MKNILKLLRIHQYTKNLFVFLPLFFSMNIDKLNLLYDAFIAFIAFSLVASSIYILNDYLDIEDDRKHPKKRFRPLASGAVSLFNAKLIASLLVVSGLSLMSLVSMNAMYILVFYILLNIAYTIKLKHIAILDVVIIAIGFVLRLFVGAFSTGLELSSWIVMMTFLLALFLALAKRRDDVLIYDNTGEKMRQVIDGYNIKFVDTAMTLMSSIVIIAYIMYCMSPDVIQRVGSENLYLTSIFVIMGIMRYMQITFVKEDSGSPTKILMKDKMIQLVIFLWIASFGVILYEH